MLPRELDQLAERLTPSTSSTSSTPPPRNTLARAEIESAQRDFVGKNADAVATLHAQEDERVGRHQRWVEQLAGVVGKPRFLYFAIVFVAGWAGLNLFGAALGIRTWDPPPFSWLQVLLSSASFLIVVMVLIAQERQVRLADRRSQLDLQVNLLSEQRTAKLIALVEELRRDLPNVRNRRDLEAEAMKHATDPLEVLEVLERTLERGADDDAPEPGPPIAPRSP